MVIYPDLAHRRQAGILAGWRRPRYLFSLSTARALARAAQLFKLRFECLTRWRGVIEKVLVLPTLEGVAPPCECEGAIDATLHAPPRPCSALNCGLPNGAAAWRNHSLPQNFSSFNPKSTAVMLTKALGNRIHSPNILMLRRLDVGEERAIGGRTHWFRCSH